MYSLSKCARNLLIGLVFAMAGGQAAAAGTDYEPMKVFEAAAGKTWRAESENEKGETTVDVSRWEYILGGRALQITHSVNDGRYGGRTILFYDEGKKEYVFHYFTTAGFHTQGTASFDGNTMTSVEKVSGHKDIVEVRAVSTFGSDKLTTTSEYVKEDGTTKPGHSFTYVPADDAKVVFGEGP